MIDQKPSAEPVSASDAAPGPVSAKPAAKSPVALEKTLGRLSDTLKTRVSSLFNAAKSLVGRGKLARQTAAAVVTTKSPVALEKFLDQLCYTLMHDPEHTLPQTSPALVQYLVMILKANLVAYEVPPPAVMNLCISCTHTLVAIVTERQDYITRGLFNDMIDLYNSTNSAFGRSHVINVLGAMTQFAPDFDVIPAETVDIFEKNLARTYNDTETRLLALDSLFVIGLNCTHLITDNTRQTLDKIAAQDSDEYIRNKAGRVLIAIDDAVQHPNDQPIRRITTGLFLKSLEIEADNYNCDY